MRWDGLRRMKPSVWQVRDAVTAQIDAANSTHAWHVSENGRAEEKEREEWVEGELRVS